MKVLIIEDSMEVVDAMSLCIQVEWPEVDIDIATDGNTAIEQVKEKTYDILLLDLGLPDIDGLEVLNQIRSFSNIPIIIVTVRSKEEDQVEGLKRGADDYIIKPFRPSSLVNRINAVLRRSNISINEGTLFNISRGRLGLDLVKNDVKFNNLTIKLTHNEAKLLYTLMVNAGQTLSNENLIKEVWGNKPIRNDILRSYIRKLREKLRDNPPNILVTARGEGYRFIVPK